MKVDKSKVVASLSLIAGKRTDILFIYQKEIAEHALKTLFVQFYVSLVHTHIFDSAIYFLTAKSSYFVIVEEIMLVVLFVYRISLFL